eukprot:TRINITY_DN4818_c0_g1_i1.p1 TRINITY_DN4818_c0_g1~~TRINITY_DN4818_c0_g1_i1.p1  ORF type:complete len:242 (+),score=6.97 TRINITY_DN4818_c0_g1_i1:415-1140(+)
MTPVVQSYHCFVRLRAARPITVCQRTQAEPVINRVVIGDIMYHSRGSLSLHLRIRQESRVKALGTYRAQQWQLEAGNAAHPQQYLKTGSTDEDCKPFLASPTGRDRRMDTVLPANAFPATGYDDVMRLPLMVDIVCSEAQVQFSCGRRRLQRIRSGGAAIRRPPRPTILVTMIRIACHFGNWAICQHQGAGAEAAEGCRHGVCDQDAGAQSSQPPSLEGHSRGTLAQLCRQRSTWRTLCVL